MMFNAGAQTKETPTFNKEAIEHVLRLTNIELEEEKVAYCMEIICCKTTMKGDKFCKTSCNSCPIGWLPEY